MDAVANALRQVYPRVCGGTVNSRDRTAMPTGLSPRVRGNLPRRPRRSDVHRSIPACAGEPRGRCGSTGPCWVYPRVCGGTSRA